MISTTSNPTQGVWNSLIPFWQTISIFFLLQSMWKAVYAVQIQRRGWQKLLKNGQRPLYVLAEAIPRVIYIKFHHRANNHSKYADGFYNSIIGDKDGHIHSSLIMFTCTALRHVFLEWQRTLVFIRKLPSQSWKRTDLTARTTSISWMMVVRTHPAALQWVANW